MPDHTSPTEFDCAWLLPEPGVAAPQPDMRVAIGADGRIASVAPIGQPAPGPRRLALPALSNAHDHARTFRSATLGSYDKPLESWIAFNGAVPGLDPYLCAATAMARSARHGVANLMVHYTRVQGGMPYVEEVRGVARAARDVGLRIGFAVVLRDRNPIAYDEDAVVLKALRPGIRDAVARRLSAQPASPAEQLARVDEVAQMLEEGGFAGHVTPQYGPAAVQWCSTPLLEAIARASADTGRHVHMHCLETPYQRAWADRHHPQGMVRFLDEIGLLSPRLTLAHCAHARPDELALLAERGVTIAVNTSSNLYLKSGIAPVAEMLRQGCRVAMGLDGTGFDEDDDALREMRMAYMLHRGWGFDTTMTRGQLWAFAGQHGARSVSGLGHIATGRIAAGESADLMVLDWERLDDDSLFGDIDPLDLLLARANATHIDTLLVGGRRVVSQGRVQGIDEPAVRAELIARARAALAADPKHAQWLVTLRALAQDLGPYYQQAFGGCC